MIVKLSWINIIPLLFPFVDSKSNPTVSKARDHLDIWTRNSAINATFLWFYCKGLVSIFNTRNWNQVKIIQFFVAFVFFLRFVIPRIKKNSKNDVKIPSKFDSNLTLFVFAQTNKAENWHLICLWTMNHSKKCKRQYKTFFVEKYLQNVFFRIKLRKR